MRMIKKNLWRLRLFWQQYAFYIVTLAILCFYYSNWWTHVSPPVVITANCRRKLETPFSWSTSFISFNCSWSIPFNLLNYQSQKNKNKTHQKIRPLKCLALEHLERVLFFFFYTLTRVNIIARWVDILNTDHLKYFFKGPTLILQLAL